MRVTVAVCNFDGEAYLADCLRSVLAQGELVDEVLVVDNASTDRSLDVVREVAPDARIVRLEANEGPAPARNAGMREARNRWVLALDNDVVLEPGSLERLCKAAAEEGAAVLQPRSVFDAEPSRVHYDGAYFHYVGLFCLRNFYRPLAEAEGSGRVEVDGFVSLALLLDRDVVLAAGGYDPTYFVLYEDLDLSYRLRMRGHRFVSVEDALVRHKGGTPGISYREGPRYPARRTFLHARNRWVFLVKNYRVSTLVLASPGLAVYELFAFLFAVSSGGVVAYVKGKADWLRRLPATLRARREVQRGRSVGDGALLRGGPLTVTPSVASGGLKAKLLKWVDLGLRSWWSIARSLIR